MVNRKRQDYNDLGWGIHPGNYQLFLTQIDPEETSTGWWHKGPKESVYSRFARSVNPSDGKNSMYFDLQDDFIQSTKEIQLRIVWLDKGNAKWSIHYDAKKDPQKVAFTIQNSNSGEWKEKIITLNDFKLMNRGARSSDFMISAEGEEDAIFHMIEVTKLFPA